MRTVRHHVIGCAISMAVALAPVGMTGVAGAQDSAPHRVAVVDVGYIFKNHPGIKVQVSEVEAELKAFDTELKQKRDELKTLAAKLKQLTPGSPEYTKLEEQLAQMDSKLRLEMARTRQRLAEAEAKIYYDNYQHIVAGVEYLAKYYKINLVLRYNSEDMDKSESQSVIRGVMKSVVYHDDSLDMTAAVMEYLNRKLKDRMAAGGSSPAPEVR